MGHRISLANSFKLLCWQDYTCEYCKTQFDYENLPTIDHKIPITAENSTNHISNLVASCSECNFKKGDQDYEEFKNSFKTNENKR